MPWLRASTSRLVSVCAWLLWLRAPTVASTTPTVYAVTDDRDLFAINGNTGVNIWESNQASNTLDTAPIVNAARTVVYVGGKDDKVYAFNTADGATLWTAIAGEQIDTQPRLNNDDTVVYVGSKDDKVWAFNTADGSFKWSSADLGHDVKGRCLVSPDNLVVFAASHEIFALWAVDGTTKWTSPTLSGNAETDMIASHDGSVLYIAPKSSTTLQALNADDGTLAWTGGVAGADLETGPALSHDGLVLFSGCADYKVYAFHTSTGYQKWATEATGGIIETDPIVSADGTEVYVASADGKIWAFYTDYGATKWSSSVILGSRTKQMAMSADGLVLFMGNRDGNTNVVAVFTADGTVKWGGANLNKNLNKQGIALDLPFVYSPGTTDPTLGPTTSSPTTTPTGTPTTPGPTTGAPTSLAPTTAVPTTTLTPTSTTAPTTAAPSTAPTTAALALLSDLQIVYSNGSPGPSLSPVFRSLEFNYDSVGLRTNGSTLDYMALQWTSTAGLNSAQANYKNSLSGGSFATVSSTLSATALIPIPLNEQTDLSVTIDDFTTNAPLTYSLAVWRVAPTCIESQLSQWSAFSACTPSCAGASSVTRTRSVVGPLSCTASLKETTSLSCGQNDCTDKIDASLKLGGISVASFQRNQDAFKAAVASPLEGVSANEITIESITGTQLRRAFVITVKISIQVLSSSVRVASVASLTTASSDGSLATSFAQEALSLNGDVVSISTVLQSVVSVPLSSIVQGDDQPAELYITVLAFNYTVLVSLVVLWFMVAWDAKKMNRAPDPDAPFDANACVLMQAKGRRGETCIEKKSALDEAGGVGSKLLEAMMCSSPALDLLVASTKADSNDALKKSPNPARNPEDAPVLDLGVSVKVLVVVVLLPILVILLLSAAFLGGASNHVISNATVAIQCQTQSHTQLATARLLNDVVDTTQRNVAMYSAGVTRWDSAQTYVNDQLLGSTYAGSLPAIMMGVLNTTTDLLSTYAVMARANASDPASCSVLSAQWTNDTAKPLVGRLYDHATKSCYEAGYASATGYGLWAPVAGSSYLKAPLGAPTCADVTTRDWYTTACSLASSATDASVQTVSTGYIGVRYIERSSNASHPAFGAELDGRTMSSYAAQAKPTQGEVYVVSTTGTVTTLLASTEAGVSLESTSNVVDPTSVGGLTGSSASSLVSSLDTFKNLWAGSATAATAESNGYVASKCPSSTSTAYIALAEEDIVQTDTPSSGLRRFDTSVSGLELMLVNALPGDAYRERLVSSFLLTVLFGAMLLVSIVLVAWKPVALLSVKQGGVARSLHRVRSTWLWVALLVSAAGQVSMWIIVLSTDHKSAIDDFTSQVTASISSALESKLVSSASATQQAAAIWWYTGAATTNLSSLNKWTTPLMADFYTSNGLSSLRFGTHTDGLEQGANGTADGHGARVLSRNSSTACLLTMQYSSATDTAVVDPNYPADCHYDPRYTTWYKQGRTSSLYTEFTSTYNNSWVAAATKACSTGPGCVASSESSPSKWPPTANAEGLGVWGCEWRIDSTSAWLSALRDGFLGSLAIVDSQAIVLTSSSGIVIQPALTCGDTFINDAARQINSANSYGWSTSTGALKGHNIVRLSDTQWSGAGMPQRGAFMALMSFPRDQMYLQYEQDLSSGLALFVLSLLIVGVVCSRMAKTASLAAATANSETETKKKALLEVKAHPYLRELEQRVLKYIRALEMHLNQQPVLRSELKSLEGQPRANTEQQGTVSAAEVLERLTVSFLADTFRGRDVLLHLVLLITGGRFRGHLIFAFRFCNARLYTLLVNAVILALIGTTFAHVEDMRLIAALLVVLFFDVAFTMTFNLMRSRKLEVSFGGDQVQIPWRKRGHLALAALYPAMWASALIGHSAGVAAIPAFMYSLMLVVRNQEMWSSVTTFLSGVLAAAPVLYLFVCLLVVLAGMTTVLLHGQYLTDDFYTDNQYTDFVQSMTTMFVYLSTGENFVEAAEPALEIQATYILVFLPCSLLGLFFVSSLLIEIFSTAFSKAQEGESTPERRRLWLALTATFIVWTHTQKQKDDESAHTDELAAATSHFRTSMTPLGMSGQYEDADEDDVDISELHPAALRPEMFMELMLLQSSAAASSLSWMDDIRRLVDEIVTELKSRDLTASKHRRSELQNMPVSRRYRAEVAALCSICCSLQYEEHLRTIRDANWLTGTPQSCYEGRKDMHLKARLQLRVSSPSQFVTELLNPESAELTHLHTKIQKSKLSSPDQTSEHMLNFFETAKVPYLDPDDYGGTATKVDKVLCETSVPVVMPKDELQFQHACLAAIRLDQHVTLLTEEEGLRSAPSDDAADSEREVHLGSRIEQLLDEAVHDVYQLPRTHSTKVSRKVGLLIKLVQIHKWRLRIMFGFCDSDESTELTVVEFDRLISLQNLGSRLAIDPLLRQEGEVMRCERNVDQLESELLCTISKPERLDKHKKLKQHEIALQHSRVSLHRMKNQHEMPGLRIHRVVGQLLAWANIGVVSCYGDTETHHLLDILICVFPPLCALQLVLQAYSMGGLPAFVKSHAHPELSLSRYINIGIVFASLMGVLVIGFEVNLRVGRFLTIMTVLLSITHHEPFAPMMHTFSMAVSACIPLTVSLFVLMLFYGIASHHLFGDGPVDDSGIAYFGTYAQSLTTMFQLFVGEGWHGVMYAASDSTNQAARLWFASYMFLVSILGSEMFVGVIISLYADVEQISSPHIFTVLEPVFRDYSPQERELLTEDMLEVNHKSRRYNELFLVLVRGWGRGTDKDHASIGASIDLNAEMEMSEVMQPSSTWLSNQAAGQLLEDSSNLFSAVEEMLIEVAEGFGVSTTADSPCGARNAVHFDGQVLAELASQLRRNLWDAQQGQASQLELAHAEPIVQRWAIDLVVFLCEEAIRAFCFGEEQPRFSCSEELCTRACTDLLTLPEIQQMTNTMFMLLEEWVPVNEEIITFRGAHERTSQLQQLEEGIQGLLSGLEAAGLMPTADRCFHRLESLGLLFMASDFDDTRAQNPAGWFSSSERSPPAQPSPGWFAPGPTPTINTADTRSRFQQKVDLFNRCSEGSADSPKIEDALLDQY